MKKKAFKELIQSISEARRIELIDKWLSDFPCKKYFKSKTCIHEHISSRMLYDYINDCTGGAR